MIPTMTSEEEDGLKVTLATEGTLILLRPMECPILIN